jgi:threonyl-tRNA synthetase
MPDTIQVKLPDGSQKEVPKGTTALDVARSISPRLADAALAAQVRPTHNGNEPGSSISPARWSKMLSCAC